MLTFAASLVSSWEQVGGLTYEKDVFGRLSWWLTNFATSKSHQRTNDNETSAWYVIKSF